MAEYCYKYPRPAVTVDLLAFAVESGSLRVLLVRRKSDPFAGSWAIPGGFLNMDEPVDLGARRELREESGLDALDHLQFLGVFADPNRDPRGRTISLAHLGVVRPPLPPILGSDDAAEAAWHDAFSAHGLAFDHDAMLALGLRALQDGIDRGPFGLGLLPDPFGLADAKSLLLALRRRASSASGWIRSRMTEGRIASSAGEKGIYRSIATRDGLDPSS